MELYSVGKKVRVGMRNQGTAGCRVSKCAGGKALLREREGSLKPFSPRLRITEAC